MQLRNSQDHETSTPHPSGPTRSTPSGERLSAARTHPVRALAIALCCIAASAGTALADKGTVRLANGGVVRGEIVVYVPGVRVSVRGEDGELYTFEATQIAEVTVGVPPDTPDTAPVASPDADAPPSPTVAPAGAPPGTAGGPSALEPGVFETPERTTLLAEREQMLRKPTVVPPIIFIGIGLLFTAIGGGLFSRSTKDFGDERDGFFGGGCSDAVAPDGCSWSFGMMVGLPLVVIGLAVITLGGVMLLKKIKERGRRARRVQEIDQILGQPGPTARLGADADRHGGRLTLQLAF